MNALEEIEEVFDKELLKIPVESKEYNNGGSLTLSVGKIESDGDWGHGGRTYIKLQDKGCIEIIVCVTDLNGKKHYFNKHEWSTVEFLAGGEWERDILTKAFSDAGNYLQDGYHAL